MDSVPTVEHRAGWLQRRLAAGSGRIVRRPGLPLVLPASLPVGAWLVGSLPARLPWPLLARLRRRRRLAAQPWHRRIPAPRSGPAPRPGLAPRSGAAPRRMAVPGPVVGPVAGPGPGPTRDPAVRAGDLPVFGAAPPVGRIDGGGAVVLAPAGTVPAGAAGPGAASPARRFAAAVVARPLEPPRVLPSRFHALARAITGRAAPPRYTTGPATRQALAAAGALGATTGPVIHLARLPRGEPGTGGDPATVAVLAHELGHLRNPVSRSRFLLARPTGAVDDDERAAAGYQAVGAGIVDRLPVGTGPGSVAEVAVRAARAVLVEAAAMPPAVPGVAPGAVPGVATGPALASTLAQTPVPTPGTTPGPVAVPVPLPAAGAAPQPAGAAPGEPLDGDRIVELLEERLLREVERRGGQWAGVF